MSLSLFNINDMPFPSGALYCVCYGENQTGTKLALSFRSGASGSSPNNMMISYNGITWSPYSTPNYGLPWRHVSYVKDTNGNGIFVATGGNASKTNVSNMMTSYDGINWTPKLVTIGEYSSNLGPLVYDKDVSGQDCYVTFMTQHSGSGYLKAYALVSYDLDTWTSTQLIDKDRSFIRSATYGYDENSQGIFVALMTVTSTNSAFVYTSSDGITWVQRNAVNNLNWVSVAYGNGVFVAVAKDGLGGNTGTTRIMYSTNGKDWFSSTNDLTYHWNCITYGNGYFVAMGTKSNLVSTSIVTPCATSYDGINWTYRAYSSNPNTAGIWESIVYANFSNPMFISVATSSPSGPYTNKSKIATAYVEPPELSNFTIPEKYTNSTSFSLTPPTSNSTGTFTYTSSNSSVATIATNTSTVSLKGTSGTSTITATQSPTLMYAQGSITSPLNVFMYAPTLFGFSIPSKLVSDESFVIPPPQSNSSGAFTYTSSIPAVATINGNNIDIHNIGSTTITAIQSFTEDFVYSSGTITTQFSVYNESPNLHDFNIPVKRTTDSSFEIPPPQTNSTGTLSYTSSNQDVAKIINGNFIAIQGIEGTSNITAIQAPTNDYMYSSGSITTLFEVLNQPMPPNLRNFSIPPNVYGSIPFKIPPPETDSDGAFSYESLNTDVAEIVNNDFINMKSVGTTTIVATQAETDIYESGTISCEFIAEQSTIENPVVMNDSYKFEYFMNTTSEVGKITSDIELNTDLTSSTFKILLSDEIITIVKNI